jgi:hypothetical protein
MPSVRPEILLVAPTTSIVGHMIEHLHCGTGDMQSFATTAILYCATHQVQILKEQVDRHQESG